jgi:hypothetical protein
MAKERYTPGTWIREIFHLTTLVQLATAVAILAALYLISVQNFFLFHGIVELAGIAVALSIFIIIWNTRRAITDGFFLILGISFLFFGSIDLVHTLAHKGMGIFPGNSADLPTQLWIAARYFQCMTFLIATLFIGRSITRRPKIRCRDHHRRLHDGLCLALFEYLHLAELPALLHRWQRPHPVQDI